MTRETFIDRNKTILDTDFYLYLSKCENEKQQLIKFLEDKTKKYENDKHNYPHLFTFYIGILGAYEEVLDFIEKGGKE